MDSARADPEADRKGPSDFSPKLYHFKIPENAELQDVGAPPSWALLDHLIAVVWHLYSTTSDKHESPGITHFQWALEFLKSILPKGKRYPNIEVVIAALDEVLIKKYASLKNSLEKSQNEKSRKAQKPPLPDEDDDVHKMPSEETMSSDDFNKRKMQEENKKQEKPYIPVSLKDILSRQPLSYVFPLPEMKPCDSETGSERVCNPSCLFNKDYSACDNVIVPERKPTQEQKEDLCKEKVDNSVTINSKKIKEEILKQLEDLRQSRNDKMEKEQEILQMISDIITNLKPEDINSQHYKE